MKDVLRQGMFLHFPNFKTPFYVATDASDVGVGAVLYQLRGPETEDYSANRLHNLFAARALHSSERNYSATKKELLGIVFALKRFHYFYGEDILHCILIIEPCHSCLLRRTRLH